MLLARLQKGLLLSSPNRPRHGSFESWGYKSSKIEVDPFCSYFGHTFSPWKVRPWFLINILWRDHAFPGRQSFYAKLILSTPRNPQILSSEIAFSHLQRRDDENLTDGCVDAAGTQVRERSQSTYVFKVYTAHIHMIQNHSRKQNVQSLQPIHADFRFAPFMRSYTGIH